MKIQARYRPEVVQPAKDSGKQNIARLFYNGEDKLYATNGSALAVIPVEVEADDEPCAIPPKLLTEARKATPAKRKIPKMVSIRTKKDSAQLLTALGTAAVTIEPLSPPAFDVVIPKAEPAFRFALSAKFLAHLAQAIGDESVVLEFSDTKDPFAAIKVLPNSRDGNAAFGVLMPHRIMRPDK